MKKDLIIQIIGIVFFVFDKLNKPFINFRFNKESCREVEPFGRGRALKQRDVNRLIKKLN